MQVPEKKEMNINSVKLFKPTEDVSISDFAVDYSHFLQFTFKFKDAPLNPVVPESIKKQVELIKSNFDMNAPIFQPSPMLPNGFGMVQNGFD